MAKSGKGGLDGGVFKDPWGNAYTIMLDTSYDNKISAYGQTNFTTVTASSPGGTNASATNNLISTSKYVGNANRSVTAFQVRLAMRWSRHGLGPKVRASVSVKP